MRTFAHSEEAGGLAIDTFLMKPVQRICRYPLLLKHILQTTPAAHSDRAALAQALAKVEAVVATVNERRRHVENSERIMAIDAQLGLAADASLLTPTRRCGSVGTSHLLCLTCAPPLFPS